MSKLDAKMGKPPYTFAQFYTLREQWMTIMNEISSGQFDKQSTVDTIEMMEVLASRMRIRPGETFWEVFNGEHQTLDDAHWRSYSLSLGRDIHDALSSIFPSIMKMKEMLFEASHLPLLNQPITDCAALCQYCDWVFSRCEEVLRYYRPDDMSHDTATTTHLCAIDYLPDLDSLKTRSVYGCKFCFLLRDLLLSPHVTEEILRNDSKVALSEPLHVWVTWNWQFISTEDGNHSDLKLKGLSVQIDGPVSGDFDASHYFFVESVDAELAAKLGMSRPPQENPLSPSNISFIQQKIGAPRDELYQQSVSEAFVPRRLVYIDLSLEVPPRLIDTDSVHTDSGSAIHQDLTYAALSYCWGPESDASQQLKLTRETSEQFHKEIPLEITTPVLHDAFIVCRALSISYIWIDALCIIQGDASDWEEQSSQMNKIFEHAYITICTPASSSCMQGFLMRTKRSRRPAIQIGYSDENDMHRIYSLGLWPFEHTPKHIPVLSALQFDLGWSAWACRGWIIQERVLSCTQIIFGSRMIHILQDGVIYSENGETGSVDPVDIDSTSEDEKRMSTIPQASSLLAREKQDLLNCWYAFTERYQAGLLTNKMDLFPALSGIAGFFEQLMQDQYLAGLWENDLHCGLIWNKSSPLYGDQEPQSFGEILENLESQGLPLGPSWSWASRLDTCYFDIMLSRRYYGTLRREFTLLHSDISIDGLNRRGRVKRASLKISGLMIRLRDLNVSYGYHYITSSRPIENAACIYSDWNTWIGENEEDHLQLLLISSDFLRDGSDEDDDKSDNDPCMQNNELNLDATTDCSIDINRSRFGRVWGLLIYPAGPNMTFYRVGTFVCEWSKGGLAMFDGLEAQTLVLL